MFQTTVISTTKKVFFDDVASMCTVNMWIFVVYEEGAVVQHEIWALDILSLQGTTGAYY